MILTPLGVTFHPVVVIGLGKNILFKSVLAHCEDFDFCKSVSDLETFLDYFALHGRSCEKLNFLAHSS